MASSGESTSSALQKVKQKIRFALIDKCQDSDITALILVFPPGKITGADYKLYKNAGWGSDASPDVMATAMVQLDNSYEFPR